MEIAFHPMLVHFPIALLFTSVLFDGVGVLSERESFRDGAFWLLVLGVAGGVASVVSGLAAEEVVAELGVAESLIERHESLAFLTMGIFAALLLGRLWLRNQLTGRTLSVYLLVSALGLVVLSATGHYGGSLVHDHGTGAQAGKRVQSDSTTALDRD